MRTDGIQIGYRVTGAGFRERLAFADLKVCGYKEFGNLDR